jgi:hypothetical protein
MKKEQEDEGRWRNHRTPGKSSNQERQEQEKRKRMKRKRKKGGGGTTALQGSHQNKKGKTGKEEEGRWRNHRTPGKSSEHERQKEQERRSNHALRSLVP